MFVHEVLFKLMKYHRHDEIAAVLVDRKEIRTAMEKEYIARGYTPKTLTDDDVDAVFQRFIQDIQIDARHSMTILIADHIQCHMKRPLGD